MVALMGQVFLALIIVTALIALGDALKQALVRRKERRVQAAAATPPLTRPAA